MRAATDVELECLDLFMCYKDDDDVVIIPETDAYLTGVLACFDLNMPSESDRPPPSSPSRLLVHHGL